MARSVSARAAWSAARGGRGVGVGIGLLPVGLGRGDLLVQRHRFLLLRRLGRRQLRRLGLHRGGGRVQRRLRVAQRGGFLLDLAGQALQHDDAAQRVLRRGGHGEQGLGGIEREALDHRQQRLHRLGAGGEPGGGVAALALQVVHAGGGGLRGGLGLAQLRRGGDALVGQALRFRGRGGGAGGGLLLRRLFRRARPFRVLHLLRGSPAPSAAAWRRRGSSRAAASAGSQPGGGLRLPLGEDGARGRCRTRDPSPQPRALIRGEGSA